MNVKICGVTTVDDARACASLGANAIGLNFVTTSPRAITVLQARAIVHALRESNPNVLVVGVVANMTLGSMRDLVRDAELGCLQLHGDESPDDLTPLLPHAYKAVRIQTADDVTKARKYGGEYVLVDAKVDGVLGGSGEKLDWSLVTDLAREKKLTLAGGLNPSNVAEAIRAVRPYCVDVASGVEHRPGVKDIEAVRAFVKAARDA